MVFAARYVNDWYQAIKICQSDRKMFAPIT